MHHAKGLVRTILALAALFLLTAPALAAGGRFALVIGNSAYKEKPLKNPANDARDMANTLKRLGFDVQLKTDVGLRDMEEAINQFGDRLRRGGVGLFYFAGHGVQVQGVNYLVPVGSKVASESDARFECVDAGRVLGKMEDAGNELNIVILDACRNNPFARSFRSVSQGLAQMDAPTGSIVAYATAPNAVASDGKGTNGMYTKYLLQNMTTPGIPIEEVFKRVRIAVMGESAKKQVPWESSSIAGYFYLAGTPAPVPAVMTPSASTEQRQQEQKLRQYIAGLEAEKRQVEQERADLERRRQQLDQEAAKKLAEAQAPQDKRLRDQLSVLEAERRKLEQERMALEDARKENERYQAAQAAKAKQAQQQAQQKAPAPTVGPLASVSQPRPRVDDRASVLSQLAGVWRLETDGNWRFPMLQLKPGGDTLYGTLVGDERLVRRAELTGLAVEDGNLHVRLDLHHLDEQPEVRSRRLSDILRGLQKESVRTIECVGNLRQSSSSGIPLACERVDGAAAQRGVNRRETGRMVRVGASRGY